MEDRIILFKLFLIKRNIYEKFIKVYYYMHLDGNFENFLLAHVEEHYSELVPYAFTWETVDMLNIDVCDNWLKISIEWHNKSKLISNILKND